MNNEYIRTGSFPIVALGNFDERSSYQICEVCRRLPEESDREVANLLEIKDHYPKYVVTLDELATGNVSGVKIMHLADFLLSESY